MEHLLLPDTSNERKRNESYSPQLVKQNKHEEQ